MMMRPQNAPPPSTHRAQSKVRIPSFGTRGDTRGQIERAAEHEAAMSNLNSMLQNNSLRALAAFTGKPAWKLSPENLVSANVTANVVYAAIQGIVS